MSSRTYPAPNSSLSLSESVTTADLARQPVTEWPTMAAYKEFNYRNRCADKYGMFLVINETGSWTPYMKVGGKSEAPEKSIQETYQERFGSCAI